MNVSLPCLLTCCCCVALAQPASAQSDAEAQAQVRLHAAYAALEAGQVDAGRQALTHLVDELPYTDAGRQAFVRAREVYRACGGAAAETDFLLQVASRLAWVAEPGAAVRAGTARTLLAEAMVEVGRIRLQDNGLTEGAVRMLNRALPVARGTPWEDDALIWLARGLRQQGRLNEALSYYDELIRTQQAAWFFGVYLSPFYDDALYEVALILEHQERLDEAQDAYAELFRRVPLSDLQGPATVRLRALRERLQPAWNASVRNAALQ